MRTVVAVLRGGPSSEYDLSLRSGAAVLEALDKEKYEPRDIFIDRTPQGLKSLSKPRNSSARCMRCSIFRIFL